MACWMVHVTVHGVIVVQFQFILIRTCAEGWEMPWIVKVSRRHVDREVKFDLFTRIWDFLW